MKKIPILLFALFAFKALAQSKSTGVINLTSNMTANFTLNNTTSKVTLVLTGPSDRWFALGLGVASGFEMDSGDVIVYTTSLNDRNYIGFSAPAIDASQDWTTVSNNVVSGVRILTLERALTNSDSDDLQLSYATTSSINLAWALSGSASTSLAYHGSSNRGFATGTFTTLGTEDFSLNSSVIFPNPSNGNFSISSKTILNKVNIYSQTGALVKSIEVAKNSNEAEVKVNGLISGIYFIELLNDSEKSWRKIIIE
jgi:hypothetical protein